MEFGDFEIPDCDCVNDGRDDVRPVDMTDEEFEISFAEATAGPDDYSDDAEALASAGRGTDEDYFLYDDGSYEPPETDFGMDF
jgi:hypothetical protein